ncbi:hypothetical protein M501DRAFT_1028375 [Patellaria atrata CBS 101060]|uniref:Uncharacterized protein n=1 Tax=Patellaria atrata CBS 101060 TaxID=1346257 RepID=A0A9P4SJ21_9PEZI|nr:hypothetical protein M501DRAFT_1028375 [Patellaria atrata CBS 101060]
MLFSKATCLAIALAAGLASEVAATPIDHMKRGFFSLVARKPQPVPAFPESQMIEDFNKRSYSLSERGRRRNRNRNGRNGRNGRNNDNDIVIVQQELTQIFANDDAIVVNQVKNQLIAVSNENNRRDRRRRANYRRNNRDVSTVIQVVQVVQIVQINNNDDNDRNDRFDRFGNRIDNGRNERNLYALSSLFANPGKERTETVQITANETMTVTEDLAATATTEIILTTDGAAEATEGLEGIAEATEGLEGIAEATEGIAEATGTIDAELAIETDPAVEAELEDDRKPTRVKLFERAPTWSRVDEDPAATVFLRQENLFFAVVNN